MEGQEDDDTENDGVGNEPGIHAQVSGYPKETEPRYWMPIGNGYVNEPKHGVPGNREGYSGEPGHPSPGDLCGYRNEPNYGPPYNFWQAIDSEYLEY